MQKLKKILSALLAAAVIVAALPLSVLTALAATTDDYTDSLVYGTDGKLTRAEWLHNLSVVFNMTVDSGNEPDNYFADLPETHKYYSDVLLTVEFGVVNVEAGGEICPDDPATRDFTASTLNYCLGYQPTDNDTYSFSDSAECTDKTAALVAVERGWFKLISGKFLPDKQVETAEVKAMLNDALAVLEAAEVDENYDSKYTLQSGVIAIPEETEVTQGEDGSILITDCPKAISAGDKFAVYFNGIPVVYTAQSVLLSGNITEIKTDGTADNNAFTAVDGQGSIGSDSIEILPAEGVDVEVENETASSAARSGGARRAAGTKSIRNINAAYSLPGGLGKVSVKIKNPIIDYQVSNSYAFVTLKGESEITYSAAVSASSAFGLKSITLFTCNVLGIGSFDITAEIDFSGSVSGTVKGYMTAGVECRKGDRIRLIKYFEQKEYYINAEVSASAGLKVSLGVTKMPIIKAFIYAEAGATAKLKTTVFTDGKTPHQCTHFAAYLYARYGASASASFMGWSVSESFDENIFSENNSPLRIVHHYEDGSEVGACTRGLDYTNYFTRGGSRYGGCGWFGANGAYGLNADGTPMALYTYTQNSDENGITITKYNGNSYSVYIPAEIDGYTVTRIGDSAFENKSIVNLNIPDTVTEIGAYAFGGCTSLKNIKLSKSLEKMGGGAFAETAAESIEIPKSLKECDIWSYWSYDFNNKNYDIPSGPFNRCDNLKKVTFESGITAIPSNLFSGCTGLESITIPDTVTVIENSAFRGALRLKDVTIGNSVTKIDNYAFNTCVSLQSISIPDSVTEIGDNAFGNCTSLKNIKLSKSLEKMGESAFKETAVESIEIPKSLKECDIWGYWSYDFNNKNYEMPSGPFYACENLKNVSFEKGTTEISRNLFAGCTGLESITIPDTVTIIEESAFKCALRLKNVTIGNSVTKIDNYAFDTCVSLQSISIPDSVTEIGAYAFGGCTSLKNIKLSKSLEKMGGGAFAETAAESIEIPKSLKECDIWSYWSYDFNNKNYEMPSGPFYACENLKNVSFEKGTTEISRNLFAGCTGLESITIPDTVTIIEESAFKCALRLKNVTIGNSVTKIDGFAFDTCVSLQSISIPDSVTEIGFYSFNECTALKGINIPDSVTNIYYYAFNNCTSLKDIKLSKSLKEIGGGAFENTAVESIEIPKSLKECSYQGFPSYNFNNKNYEIPSGPFYACENLKNVSFENGTTKISRYLFAGCTGLESITIPDTVTVIENSAFRGALRLKDVTIGNSVTKIDGFAFDTCVSLQSISIPDSVTEIGFYSFNECTALKSINIPDNVTLMQEYTFNNCSSLKTIELPSSVTKIRQYAFYGCTSLESVTFKNGKSALKEIESKAFYGCTALREAVLPETVKTVGNYAFQNSTSLEKVYIPQSVKTVGTGAFKGCTALSNLKIADYGITEIQADTFMDCPALAEVILPKGLKTVGDQAFKNGTGLIKVTIPDSVTEISATAFSYPAKTAIYGSAGSYAETFAANGGFKFNDNKVEAEGFALSDGAESIDLEVGETYRAVFEFFPENATDTVTLKSSNSNVSISGMDIYARYTGDCVITATASNGLTYEFGVHTRRPSKITVKQQPDKLRYKVGESFDRTGAVIEVVYNDGFVKTVDDWTYTGFDSSSEGSCAVTVRWVSADGSAYTATINTEIYNPAPKLTGIKISQLPYKLIYAKKTTLNTAGIKVMGMYDDGSEKELTGCTFGKINALKLGVQKINVTYGEFSTKFNVTVTASGYADGDVNQDGVVDIRDLIRLKKRLAAEKAAETKTSDDPADVDKNNLLNAVDITVLKKILLGVF